MGYEFLSLEPLFQVTNSSLGPLFNLLMALGKLLATNVQPLVRK